jgi:hypothetical protein
MTGSVFLHLPSLVSVLQEILLWLFINLFALKIGIKVCMTKKIGVVVIVYISSTSGSRRRMAISQDKRLMPLW